MHLSTILPARQFRFRSTLATLALLAATPLSAQTDCQSAAASSAAASSAMVTMAKTNVDGLNGLMLCIWPLMDRDAFRAAMVDASSRIGDDALAMLVIELGSNLMLNAEVQIVPDATITEPPASAS